MMVYWVTQQHTNKHQQTMLQSKKVGYINWHGSSPRLLGGLDDLTGEDIFNWYRTCLEFEDVVFNWFKERLADHHKQSARDHVLARCDAEGCATDRKHNPRNEHNRFGEFIIDLHPAKRLLQMDVANGLHEC